MYIPYYDCDNDDKQSILTTILSGWSLPDNQKKMILVLDPLHIVCLYVYVPSGNCQQRK